MIVTYMPMESLVPYALRAGKLRIPGSKRVLCCNSKVKADFGSAVFRKRLLLSAAVDQASIRTSRKRRRETAGKVAGNLRDY